MSNPALPQAPPRPSGTGLPPRMRAALHRAAIKAIRKGIVALAETKGVPLLRLAQAESTQRFQESSASTSFERGLLKKNLPWKTTDFLSHYFFGNGKLVDLEDIGLLERFQQAQSVRAAVQGFKDLLRDRSNSSAIIAADRFPRSTRILTELRTTSRAATNVTNEPGLFVIGDSTFFRYAVGLVTTDAVHLTYSFTLDLEFKIRDEFKEPFDIPKVEAPGGTRYRINATWVEKFSGSGDIVRSPMAHPTTGVNG